MESPERVQQGGEGEDERSDDEEGDQGQDSEEKESEQDNNEIGCSSGPLVRKRCNCDIDLLHADVVYVHGRRGPLLCSSPLAHSLIVKLAEKVSNWKLNDKKTQTGFMLGLAICAGNYLVITNSGNTFKLMKSVRSIELHGQIYPSIVANEMSNSKNGDERSREYYDYNKKKIETGKWKIGGGLPHPGDCAAAKIINRAQWAGVPPLISLIEIWFSPSGRLGPGGRRHMEICTPCVNCIDILPRMYKGWEARKREWDTARNREKQAAENLEKKKASASGSGYQSESESESESGSESESESEAEAEAEAEASTKGSDDASNRKNRQKENSRKRRGKRRRRREKKQADRNAKMEPPKSRNEIVKTPPVAFLVVAVLALVLVLWGWRQWS